MSSMQRDDAGDWKYTPSDTSRSMLGEDQLEVEWARSRRKEIVLNIGGNRAWIQEGDLEEVIDAMRDALKPPCSYCHGTGRARQE